MNKWLELAAKCEAATGPSIDIDDAIAAMTGMRVIRAEWPIGRAWCNQDGHAVPIYRFSASIDAITALIEREVPGWAWRCDAIHALNYAPCHGDIWRPSIRGLEVPHIGKDRFCVGAATPALALCAAFCRSMAAKSPEETPETVSADCK